MAKATATCTCKMCGKTFYKSVEGCNRREADDRARWAADYFDLCEECYKLAGLEKWNGIHQTQIGYGFAELKGPEWLIQKAVQKRQEFIEYFERKAKPEALQQLKGETEATNAVIIKMKEIGSASWWYNVGQVALIPSVVKEMVRKEEEAMKALDEAPEEAPKSETAPAEQAPEPFVVKAEGAINAECIIKIKTNRIIVNTTGYSKAITDVMHGRKYTWSKTGYFWQRKKESDDVTLEDMAAEIGAHLNHAHVTCTFPSEEIAMAALGGTYNSENLRSITAEVENGKPTGWLTIDHEGSAELDDAALQLKGAGRHNYKIHVYARGKAADIRDFAATYGYKISEDAEEQLKKFEAATLIGTATLKKMEDKGESVSDILNSSRDVLEDLKDES